MGAGPFDLRYFLGLSFFFVLPYSLLCPTFCFVFLIVLLKINPQIPLHTTVPVGLEAREFQSIRK